MAATSPGMVCSLASTSRRNPRSFSVFEVIGPMLAISIFSGSGSFRSRKCSTVEELVKVEFTPVTDYAAAVEALVKVIMSAPSSLKRSMAS